MKIISLERESVNRWKARYQGNYGIYTIRLTLNGNEADDYSCTCPSDYYPCKHIDIIKEAILERISREERNRKEEINTDEILNCLSVEELRSFISSQMEIFPKIKDNMLFEFSDKINNDSIFNQIIRNGLMDFNFDDADDSDLIGVDILDEWYYKAKACLAENNPRKAFLIATACIREFAQWLYDNEDYLSGYPDDSYLSGFFRILEKTAFEYKYKPREIYTWCNSEMLKKQYKNCSEDFEKLVMKLMAELEPEKYIPEQERRLGLVADKTCYEAEKILRSEFDFYIQRNDDKAAWKLIGDNLQIVSFRKMLIEKMINEKQYGRAKKLIMEYVDSREGESRQKNSDWYDYLLLIAEKQNDVPAIRNLAFGFLENSFRDEYYKKYKAAFSEKEWPDEFEKLVSLYSGTADNSYSISLLRLFAREKQAERLLNYVEQHLNLGILLDYYLVFADAFPERTLALFKKTVDAYAEEHVGRSYYAEIIAVFKKMDKISGGNNVVKGMISEFRVKYKNRRAFMELLNTIKIKSGG